MKSIIFFISLFFILTSCAQNEFIPDDPDSVPEVKNEKSSSKKSTKKDDKWSKMKRMGTWYKIKGGNIFVYAVGCSSALENPGEELKKAPNKRFPMTYSQADADARGQISFFLQSTVKYYKTKNIEVKEISTKTKFHGSRVIDRKQDPKNYSICSVIELELTDEILEKNNIKKDLFYKSIKEKTKKGDF